MAFSSPVEPLRAADAFGAEPPCAWLTGRGNRLPTRPFLEDVDLSIKF